MAQLTVAVYSKVKRLLNKCKNDPAKMDALRKVLWYSMHVVYPEWNVFGHFKAAREYEKVKHRRKRVNAYVREMLELDKPMYLVTLTYGECYDSTTQETRLAYARKWLNTNCLDYYACLDIGKENGREHYHAVCVMDKPMKQVVYGRKAFYEVLGDSEWKHGFYSIRRIEVDRNAVGKTLGYAFKASNYAFKSADSSIKPFHKRGVWVHAKGKMVELPDWYIMA